MKSLLLMLPLLLLAYNKSYAQTEFELGPSQSMLMTGKGPGQDGAINPYYGENCYSIVKNIGESDFSIRIQQKGEIIEIIPISTKEVKRIKLLKGHELYLDSNAKEKITATVDFEEIDD